MGKLSVGAPAAILMLLKFSYIAAILITLAIVQLYNSCSIIIILYIAPLMKLVQLEMLHVIQFIQAADSLTDELGIMLNSAIINNTTILVINNSDVSFVDSSGIYIHLFFHRTQIYIVTALK